MRSTFEIFINKIKRKTIANIQSSISSDRNFFNALKKRFSIKFNENEWKRPVTLVQLYIAFVYIKKGDKCAHAP